ncbi:hypothetical protein CW705_08710 [Candidatus Bathyarchaeota archaeon]|nr:MAG: hypothetical protein CW705_08710 [Candidatus Bathyarchaeota archaeon]
MTLVIALKWPFSDGDAVLMVSDTRATSPIGIIYESKKIHAVITNDGKSLAIVGGAGDTALIKWAFEVADEVVKEFAGEDGLIYFGEIRRAVRKMEDIFMARLRELRRAGLDPSFQLILGSVDLDGKASLYEFDNRGLAEPVHDHPGYAIIGSGLITGGILLLRLLGYRPDIDLGLLTAFILDMVSEVDYSVGPFVGESYLMRIETKGNQRNIALGPLKEEALREYKEKIAKRRELIREFWRLCDEVGEEPIETAFKSFGENK